MNIEGPLINDKSSVHKPPHKQLRSQSHSYHTYSLSKLVVPHERTMLLQEFFVIQPCTEFPDNVIWLLTKCVNNNSTHHTNACTHTCNIHTEATYTQRQHTHTHTHTHTYTHTHTHTHKTRTHSYMHTYTRTHERVYTCTHRHIPSSHIHICVIYTHIF